MAAGQQKKRLITSSLHEHYRGKKKKKPHSSDYVLNLRSQIFLEWDDSRKRAVAKREQIAITWPDMAPFVDSVPQLSSGLADVFPVPHKIFGLDNLMEVLSYEVWGTCLSESERKFLTQFLPSGTDVEETVHSLLAGDDHDFGNTLVKWSTSLCSGNLHPDNVLRREKEIRANKKQYYLELNKYHTNMLDVLQNWKVRWSSCKDPEKLWRKGLPKHKQGASLIFTERVKVASLSKIEVPQKVYTRNGDIAKYMSYIKVSKKQHEAIKNLKQSSDGIHSKSLNRIIGDIKDFNILPCEALEEEEKIRWHEHWLQVVNKDLPVAFEAHEERKLQRQQLRKCLEQEFAEKTSIAEENQQHGEEDRADQRVVYEEKENIVMTEEKEYPESSAQEEMEDGVSEDCMIDTIIPQDVASLPNSDRSQHLERIPSLNSHQEPSTMPLDQVTVDPDVLIPSGNSPVIPQFFGHRNFGEGAVEPKASTSPAKDLWQTVDTHGYNSSGDLSLKQPQPSEEHRAPMIDLERSIIDQESGQSDHASLFSSYANQGQEELLPPFLKGSEILPSYPPHDHINDLKQPQLQFLMANRSLSESSQFPHQFQEPPGVIEQRQAREKELFMQQMMNKTYYSNGRYQNQELYSSVNSSLVGHSWFPNDHRTNSNCWTGVEPSSSGAHSVQCLGDGSNTDGSLFSVLSGCTNLPSRSPYDTFNSEQLRQATNLVPNNDNVYGYVPHQFKNSSSLEAAAANNSALNVSWLNYQQHQNSNVQDSMEKPFMRSWNQ